MGDKKSGCLLVAWDFASNGDKPILLVGVKTPKHAVEIINAFEGEEAVALFKKLTETGKEKGESDGSN